MSELIQICTRGELPPDGHAKEVELAGRMFCVANIGGDISVVDNECPHHGGPLGDGMIEGGKIVCPWHAWEFDLKTGASTEDPDTKIGVYPVRVEGENVLVEI
jgi:nitrite reductase (NADH) small subunit